MNKYLFIYKTKSGFLPDLRGALKKATVGESVCALCNITHGVVSEKEIWADFVESLDPSPEFYHSDNIPDRVQRFINEENVGLPVVLEQDGAFFSIVATASDLENCAGDPECLINKLQ